jgi:hypothetical protein
VRASRTGLIPASPTESATTAAVTAIGSRARASASAPLAATIEAAGKVKRERPNWSAMAPQAGAATSWVAAESAANSPIVPRSRPSAR